MINKANIKRMAVVCFVSVLLSLLIVMVFRDRIAVRLMQETELTLTEVTKQDALLLQEKINGTFSTLHMIADFIGREGLNNNDAVMKILRDELGDSRFTRVGLLDINGKVIYGSGLELKNMPSLVQALHGYSKAEYMQSTPFGDAHSMVFSVPVYSDGKIVGALYGVYNADDLKNLFAVSCFNGSGDSFVVDKAGNLIIPLKNMEKTEKLRTVFKNWQDEQNSEAMQNLLIKLQQNGEGVERFVLPELGDEYIACAPLNDVEEIYALSTIPANLVIERIHRILNLLTIVIVLLLTILLIIFIYMELMSSRNQAKVYQLAYIDNLTGLGNRALMEKEAGRLIGSADRLYAVAAVDIDKFKAINEIMGFAYGTEIIKDVAANLHKHMQEGEASYRGGNDLFYMLLRSKGHDADKKRIEQMLDAISQYYSSNYNHAIAFSCGVYIVTPDKKEIAANFINFTGTHIEASSFPSIATCIDNANIARGMMKGYSENGVAFFDDNMRKNLRKEKELEDDFAKGMELGEFVMYFQPKYLIQGDKPVMGGAEALVRWFHTKKGFISPGGFIPLFERDGNAVRLDMHIFELVCRQLAKWHKEGLSLVPVSINVSRQTLMRNQSFLHDIKSLMAKYEIKPEWIELEILESGSDDSIDKIISFLVELKRNGLKIAMDDFGSGYSSLGLLKNMPLDSLKLDKSFFDDWQQDCEGSERETGIVRTIIQMAKTQGMITIAEGIEKEYQVKLLKEYGCDMIQGYYFSKPLPADEFVKKLTE